MAHPQLHSTCDDCDSLLQDATTLLSCPSQTQQELTEFDEGYQSHLQANVISESCHMCVLLHADIPRLAKPLTAGERLIIGVTKAADTEDRSRPAIIELFRVNDRTTFAGTLSVERAGHGTVQMLRSPQTWSRETLNRLRNWLKDCFSSHEKCPSPNGSDRHLRRLVDVCPTALVHGRSMKEMGQWDFDQLSIENAHGVRVVSAQALPPNTEYLTLSHRWGDPPGMLLTQETSSLLAGDFSMHLLSREEAAVFRHAIHVTRALGFRYIWIDALCIMQDNETEKTTDIMHMDSVYSNSTLNISATEGDVYKGLIFDRDALRTNPCIATVNAVSTQESMRLQVFRERGRLRLSEGPLNQRGWVFQERMLAPRIVHFTKEQVFWECWSLEASEVLPVGLPYSQTGEHDKAIGIKPGRYDVAQMKSRWYYLVEGYSRTSLTFADDYLLAISAMAKRFCSEMDIPSSQYLAGMWADDLPLSLVWFQDSESMSGSQADEIDLERPHAPSWSWASIMASIRNTGTSNALATTKIISINTKRSSPNYFDDTDLCYLRIRGPVCRVHRYMSQGTYWIQVTRDVVLEEFDHAFCNDGRSIVMFWDTTRKFTSDEFFLLHVGTWKQHEGPTVRGLILLGTADGGTYKRVGAFLIPPWTDYPGSKLQDAFEGRLQTLDPQHYIEVDCEGQYTINII